MGFVESVCKKYVGWYKKFSLCLCVSVARLRRVRERCALPLEHSSAFPQRPLLDIEPFRVPRDVAQSLVDLLEGRDVLVLALEVGDEVELAGALVAVGVVIELAEDRPDAVLRGLRVAVHGTAGAGVDVR